MKTFISFIFLIIKIVIAVKVFYLLYLTYHIKSDENNSDLIWWGCFLIFDVWLMTNLPDVDKKED